MRVAELSFSYPGAYIFLEKSCATKELLKGHRLSNKAAKWHILFLLLPEPKDD